MTIQLKSVRFLTLFGTISLLMLLFSVGAFVSPVNAAPLSQLQCTAIDAVPTTVSTHPTGEKPQSKTWTHGGEWWAVFPTDTSGASSTGTWLWKLQENGGSYSWSEVVKLSSRTDTKADIKIDGDVIHALLYAAGNTQLVSVEFVGGTYQLWSTRPAAANISLHDDSEVATIDLDSNGRMWLATKDSSNIVAYYSDTPYSDWTNVVNVGTLDNADDIAVVMALNNGTIGVLWSVQKSGDFHFAFRAHVDDADPGIWLAEESITENTSSFADDHINVAVGADSTLYAAVKTKSDTTELIVRRPPINSGALGSWDAAYQVDNLGTRPIIELNETAGVLDVIYPTATGSGGDIVYKETAVSSINFGGSGNRITLRDGPFNDPSSMKANYNSELVILYSDLNNQEVEGSYCEQAGVTPDSADLAVSQVDSADPVTVGENVTYDISVSNNGPDAAVSVVLTDNLPSDVDFVSATPDQGSCSENSGTVTCNLGDMANGAAMAVAVIVTTTVEGTITNDVAVTSSTSDSASGNNSVSESTTVEAVQTLTADLDVSMVDAVDPVDAGQNVIYQITVSNNGPDTAVNGVLTDTLPASTNYVSAVADQGTCGEAEGVVTCDLGDILNGGTVDVTVVATTTVAGSIINNVSVGSDTDDPVSDNDSAAENTGVTAVPIADLSVDKVDITDPVTVGDNIIYQITISNDGPDLAASVLLTDTLPASVTFISAVPEQGTCNEAGGTVSCDLGDLANGNMLVVMIEVQSTAVGNVTNNVVVASNTHDPDESNNSSSEETAVNSEMTYLYLPIIVSN